MLITGTGQLLDAGEVTGNLPGWKCEYANCTETIGKDYPRKPEHDIHGWEGEPIYLCLTHAIKLEYEPKNKD